MQFQQTAHSERVEDLIAGHTERQSRGIKHPIEDFLFTYYSYRPGQLRRWHPGLGVGIEVAPEDDRAGWPFYRVVDGIVTADIQTFVGKRDTTLRRTAAVLSATTLRAPAFGCFGMHEWAMVFRMSAADARHSEWPMRLTPTQIDATVQQRPLTCTHFDAFRFFTTSARPLNLTPLSRDDEVANEQPGCLHAGMDLYRWAYKLAPLIKSSLILDCFELARDIRYLDMQASPYDFSDLQVAPVMVETPEGRAEYAARQRGFAVRSAPLRSAILNVATQALAAPLGGEKPLPPNRRTRR